MPTNDFKAFAIAGGANVIDQPTYAAAAYVTTGRGAGILPSNVYNKIARQGSIGAAAIGQLINNVLGLDALDDGNFSTLVTNFTNAIISAAIPTGRARPTFDTAAAPLHVMLNDGSIGSATSGATTRANADTQNLFVMIWNNIPNSAAPVSGGRGGSAAADWAANKNIQLGTFLGRALGFAGSGAGLTPRALGTILGEEQHTLTQSELSVNLGTATTTVVGNPTVFEGPGTIIQGTAGAGANAPSAIAALAITTTITNAPGGSPHNNMQPTSWINYEAKL